MKYDIVKFGDNVLRKKSEPVKEITDDIRALAKSMLETMYAAEGVGLAAEQVGRTESLCVIDIPLDFQDPQEAALNKDVPMPLVLINPVVSDPEGSSRRKEGCLSFPDVYIEVTRARAVTVAYTGLDGKHYEARVHGFLARAVQHEVDHLNGVLFCDKFSSAQKMIVAGKLRKLKNETLKKKSQP